MHRVVPELIIENFRAGRRSGEFRAVGMFMDLSGFSTMTDVLMQHGQHGAEVLAGLMHSVFDPLVESIFEYGGKIVGFAGDGIMALYPVETDERTISLRALASAHVIQQRLERDPVRYTVYGQFPITARIGLTLGSVSWRILQSQDKEQATYYFRGSAVDGSAEAEHRAKAGSVLLTAELTDILASDVQTEPFVASFHRFVRFRSHEPDPTPTVFPPIDLEVSRLFMPEDVIVHDVRGEFRQVVNLFMRFPDLPDETLHDFMDIIFELRQQYGGLLTRLDFGDKGCNMLMLWGAPVAYENDIGRALNFVLDLQSMVDFPITAGVTYYIAHAGYLGSAMCEDYTCYGWGVNLASRFMMNAPDSSVWIDERIARRIKNRFDFEYQGAHFFKGFSAEQKVFSLLGRKSQEVFHQGELVGREAELAQLVDCIQLLWQGNFAGMTVIWGEAGIGKSRLVYELKASHEHEKKNVQWALCHSDQILRHSFNPFRYWLLRYFGIDSSMDDLRQTQAFDLKLDDLLETLKNTELVTELDRLRTVLGALIDLEWKGSFYESLDAEGRYNNTLAVLIALIKAESLRQPIVLFIEDAQFLDEDSKAFLPRLKRSLSRGGVGYPVAILISSRHAGSTEFLPDELVDHSIVLGPLSTQALASLTEIQLGGAPSPGLVQLLEARSEGNPFFADQFLNYLQEEKLIEMTDKGWGVTRRLQEASLPADIRALLVARLDQLTRNVREVIQTASVLGREFEVHILAEMLQKDTILAEEIAEAEKAEIWSSLSQLKYIFTHGLLRDAAYAMQMSARRMELHAIALAALERIYTSENEIEHHYGELGYHAEHARLNDKALDYLRKAGRTSANSYQNSQAADYFTRALTFVAPDDMETTSDLLVERIELYSLMGKRDLQFNDLKSLEGCAKQLGDEKRLGQMMVLHAHYYATITQYLESVDWAQQAKLHISLNESPRIAVRIQNIWSSSLMRLTKYDEAMKQALYGLQLSQKFGLRIDEAKMLTIMGMIALEQKDPGLAHHYLEESLVLARDFNDRQLESTALNNLAISVGSVRGDYALAEEYYRQAFAVAKETGDRYQEGISFANLGFTAGMQGKLSEAFYFHEQALLVAREIGNIYQESYTLVNLSAIAGIQMDGDQAMEYARQAYDLAQKTRDRSVESWAQLYMGHAYLLFQKDAEAHKAYAASLKIRVELDQPSLSMEPLAGLVETALLVNDLHRASQEAEKILGYFARGGSLAGTDEPLRVYHTCYQFLHRQKDPRAQQILQTASQMLEAQVSKLKDETARKLFVENIPWRRAIHEIARSH